MGKGDQTTRTAVVYVTLTGADYRLAHGACHTAALLWDLAVDWVHAQWEQGRNPDKYEIRKFLTSLPRQQRPLYSHTTEAIAYDLHEAIETSRTNRQNGVNYPALKGGACGTIPQAQVDQAKTSTKER